MLPQAGFTYVPRLEMGDWRPEKKPKLPPAISAPAPAIATAIAIAAAAAAPALQRASGREDQGSSEGSTVTFLTARTHES